MHTIEECRQRAQECVELAQHAKSSVDRAKLLHLAECWIKLADDGMVMPEAPSATVKFGSK